MFRPLVASLVPLALAAAASAQSAAVGDKPSYTFHDALFNGQGVSSLADLHGKPVLVDFWGTHCGPCIGFAVPSAMKLAEEYGDELAVLMVECQGAKPDQMASFALGQKWLGNGAMWTTERVFNLGLEGIPQSALISPEGEIILAGYTSDIHGQLEDKIAELVGDARKAPAGAPKSLSKAWQEFAAGRYAKAVAAAQAVAADPAHADAQAAAETVTLFQKRITAKIDRAAWQAENGYPVQGLASLEKLEAGLKGGDAELAQRVTELAARTRANEKELAAAAALGKLEEKLYTEGPCEKSQKKLQEHAEKFAGTKSAERAKLLAQLSASV